MLNYRFIPLIQGIVTHITVNSQIGYFINLENLDNLTISFANQTSVRKSL
jgi:hypothetical protein